MIAKPRPAPGIVLCCAVLAAPLCTVAMAQEMLRMTIGAQPGETAVATARTELGVLVFTGGDPLIYEVRNEASQALEAVKVDPDGTVTWRSRLVRMAYETDGNPVLRFDVDDRERDVGANAAALSSLELSAQQQSDGGIRDFQVQGSNPEVRAAIEQALEESIQNSVLLFPKEPVAVGHSWDVGKRKMPFPGVGRVEYRLVATLLGVSQRDGPARAELRLEAADARFSPDADSKLAGKLSSFRLQGAAQYDVGGRFLRSQEAYGFLSLTAPNPEGGTLTLQAYMRIEMEEVRGP